MTDDSFLHLLKCAKKNRAASWNYKDSLTTLPFDIALFNFVVYMENLAQKKVMGVFRRLCAQRLKNRGVPMVCWDASYIWTRLVWHLNRTLYVTGKMAIFNCGVLISVAVFVHFWLSRPQRIGDVLHSGGVT